MTELSTRHMPPSATPNGLPRAACRGRVRVLRTPHRHGTGPAIPHGVRGRTAVRPGATAEHIDARASAVIASAGYGEYFTPWGSETQVRSGGASVVLVDQATEQRSCRRTSRGLTVRLRRSVRVPARTTTIPYLRSPLVMQPQGPGQARPCPQSRWLVECVQFPPDAPTPQPVLIPGWRAGPLPCTTSSITARRRGRRKRRPSGGATGSRAALLRTRTTDRVVDMVDNVRWDFGPTPRARAGSWVG